MNELLDLAKTLLGAEAGLVISAAVAFVTVLLKVISQTEELKSSPKAMDRFELSKAVGLIAISYGLLNLLWTFFAQERGLFTLLWWLPISLLGVGLVFMFWLYRVAKNDPGRMPLDGKQSPACAICGHGD